MGMGEPQPAVAGAPPDGAGGLALSDLAPGPLLASGGEGQVFPLPANPGWVFKRYRALRPRLPLDALVEWRRRLEGDLPGQAGRLERAAAWPLAVVAADEQPELAAGLVLPRAPDRFSVRHRDGATRLATLSYLATDPDRVSVAYGIELPEPGDPLRVALVYALARLVDAWQGGPERAGHGDLSAKNVLWSLTPVPAVFVLDCDNAALAAPGSDILDDAGRPRASTPNWDDPAVLPGGNPTLASDRYVLALTFLRLVGAAHFPLQGRQRAGGRVAVDFEVPKRWHHLADRRGLWDLLARSLSVAGAAQRPAAAEWVGELESLLAALGASDLAAAVRADQSDPRPAGAVVGEPVTASAPVDVVVHPIGARRRPTTWQVITAVAPLGAESATGHATVVVVPRPSPRRIFAAWVAAHRLVWRLLRLPGRRAKGGQRLVGLIVADLALACVTFFVLAMLVSPWIGL
jgi:hypothetical protein